MRLLLVLASLVEVVLLGVKAHRMWSTRRIRAQRARDIRLFWRLYEESHRQ
jgi:hypothetical protein